MSVFSDARDRLADRLGIGTPTAQQTILLEEALNAGLARAFSDGIPGLLRDVFMGETFGELTTVVVNDSGGTAVGDTTLTVDTTSLVTAKVAPQDILEITSGAQSGKKFLIRDVVSATSLDLGAPMTGVIEDNATTKITRRSIELPSTGSVIAVRLVDGQQLDYHPQLATLDPFDTGTPMYFDQRHSSKRNKSYIHLYPAPTSGEEVTVIQNRAITNDDSDAATMSEEAMDAVLERSFRAYLTWRDKTDSVQAGLSMDAVQDTDNQLKDAHSAHKIFIRGG